MRRLSSLLFLAFLLAACGKGDKQTVSVPVSWAEQGLIYAYPYNGQTQIAPTAPMVLHFSAPLTDTNLATLAGRFTLTGPGNATVALTAERVDEGRGVVLTPTAAALAENSSYALSWSGLNIEGGAVKPVPLQFLTRPANKGPKSLASSGPFAVARMLPAQADFPLMDFSSLRLQFTQPLAPASVNYGTTVRLETASGSLVPATLLVSNRLMTIDPKDDLSAGSRYTLKLSNGIASTFGEALNPGDYAAYAFEPKDSAPREMMALTASAGSAAMVSPLTGRAINSVPIQSHLVGNDSVSQQSGNLFTELAFIPHYPKAVPLRVKKGNLLSGSSVDVAIVGKVPANLNTGAISVNVISDANGYMVENPYTDAANAPRHIYLTMDVAMSAENPSANGAFTQNILHVDVVGTAIVNDAKLVMDAVGVVELDVLGLDQASGVLSFHLEGYRSAAEAPAPTVDTTAPTLQSWTPGNEADRARPGDPVILNFSEPLDPQSLALPGAIGLRKGNVAEPFDWRVDGSAVVVSPRSPLVPGANYRVQLSAQVTDIAGNPLDQTYDLAFQLPALVSATARSPITLSTYPGFPCATTGRDVANNAQGRCTGGKTSDDLMPLPTMPTDRSIQVRFSQNMDLASIIKGTTFRVEKQNGAAWESVPGYLLKEAQGLRFTPDVPWAQGQMYRYVLGSNGDHRSNGSAAANNCGTQAICGANGLPLQTQSIAPDHDSAPTVTGGGPNMEIWFRGGPRSTAVFQSLRNLPTADSNANFIFDNGEPLPTASGGMISAPNAGRLIATGTSGLVTGANIGCAVGSSCDARQFIHMSSALDANVGDYVSSEQGVKVSIEPTLMVASGVDVYADAIPLLVSVDNPTRTGPQVMRLRYAAGPDGKRNQPITGYIRYENGEPVLSGTLEIYLDAPALVGKATAVGLLPVTLTHNLHSYPLQLQVKGPVSFLPDGRMLVSLRNQNDINISTELTGHAGITIPGGNIELRIPANTMRVEGVSSPIKR